MKKLITGFVVVLLNLLHFSCADSENNGPQIAKIIISGPTHSVILGSISTLQLTAESLDQSNKPIATSFSWSSSNVSAATVDPSGLVTVLALGSTTINAEAQGVSGSFELTVTPLPPAPQVTALVLDDITNNGDAGDFEVSFKRATDETKISEYWIVMVKSASASSFSLSATSSVSSDRRMVIAKGSQDVRVTLPVSALDSEGDLIGGGIAYTAFVLSAPDGVNAEEPSRVASNSVTLAVTTVKITFVGDMGVIITGGAQTVLIDALPPNFEIPGTTIKWIPAAPGLISGIISGEAPYSMISASLVTHDHFDHWDISGASGFLFSHPEARFLGPPQVTAQLTGLAAQVVPLSAGLFQSEAVTVDGIPVTAMRMLHFNNFGLDFSAIQNYTFLVEIGGKKILHLGDSDITDQNLVPFAPDLADIDVVIVPAATINLTTAIINRIRNRIAPSLIIAAHLELGITESQVKLIWGDDVTAFTQSLQFVRL